MTPWSIIHQKVSFCKPVLMLVQNTIRSRLPVVYITGESRLHGVFITGMLRLLGVFTTRESRLANLFITGKSFWTPGSHFTDFKEHRTIFRGSIMLKIDCRLLYCNYLGTCVLCLQKLPNLRDSNLLPGLFIPRSRLRILLTLRIFEKIRNRS